MPKKYRNNATFFILDWDTHNHRKVKMIRSKFGLQGYAVYVLLLQMLTHADGVEMTDSPEEIECLAADFGCPEDIVRGVLDVCYKNGLLVKEGSLFYAERLKTKLEGINKKRKDERERHWALEPNNSKTDILGTKSSESGVGLEPNNSKKVDFGTKGGEIREDKIREDKNSWGGRQKKRSELKPFVPPSEQECIDYFTEKGYTDPEYLGTKFWNHYTDRDWFRGDVQIQRWRSVANIWVINENKGGKFKTNSGGATRENRSVSTVQARAQFENSPAEFERIAAINSR